MAIPLPLPIKHSENPSLTSIFRMAGDFQSSQKTEAQQLGQDEEITVSRRQREKRREKLFRFVTQTGYGELCFATKSAAKKRPPLSQKEWPIAE